MKSKFLNPLFLLVWIFFSFSYVNANEAFTFNVAEIEILENGNKINGTNGGKVISDDGSTISGNNFFYNKQTNILKITDNVKYLDNVKNIAITADKIIYYINNFFNVMGSTEKLPIAVSVWTPIIFLSLINVVMLLNINEK